MASYEDLFKLPAQNNNLIDKVAVAATIKAEALMTAASPTSDQVTWANNALNDPIGMGQKLLRFVLAANSGLTVAQIEGATDAAIQSNVNTAADALIAAGITS